MTENRGSDDFIGCIGIGWNRWEECKGLPEDDGPGPTPPTAWELADNPYADQWGQ